MRPTLLIATLIATMALLVTGCSGSGGTDDSTDDSPSDSPSTSASSEPTTPSPSANGSPSASATTPAPAPTTAPPAPADANPVISRIPRRQWQRIVDAGMYRDGCPAGRDDLRRLQVNYVDWKGQVQRGEIIANRDVVPSLGRVFTRLFREKFPIRRMQSVENYDGDSDASLRADNTASFNCRRDDQTNAPLLRSPHANGRAIDINPRENPWRDPRCQPCWSPTGRFAERTPGQGKILEDGLVYRVFEREGWIWQNIDVPDYMHFDTGYPSRPWSSPRDGQ